MRTSRALVRWTSAASVTALAMLYSCASVRPTAAAGVVGTGSPGSCTELQLDAALQFGGLVTFNCGPAPITIIVKPKTISLDTVINGGSLVSLSGNDVNHVFTVNTGVSLTLQSLVVTNGFTNANSLSTAGAIFSSGTLVMRNSQVKNSVCHGLCGSGGIANGGILKMTDSIVSGNETWLSGGGITELAAGSATIVNSTIVDNHAILAGTGGGGIGNFSTQPAVLINSTVLSNSSVSDGGGIFNDSPSTLILVNSTSSGNASHGSGAGIYNKGAASLYNATVTNNQADSDFNGSGTGGGLFIDGGTTALTNTLLAGNYDTILFGGMFWISHVNDCAAGALSTVNTNGYNLAQNYNITKCSFDGGITLGDPRLNPLTDNGGPTLSHLPYPDSPAVNGGDPNGCRDQSNATLTADQRGFRRPFISRCDIGSVEFSHLAYEPNTQRQANGGW